jgi:Calpain family cysteine protease
VWRALTNAPAYDENLADYANNGVALYNKIKGKLDQGFGVGLVTWNEASRDVNQHAFSIVDAGIANLNDGRQIYLVRVFNPHHKDTLQNNAFADDSTVWNRVKNKASFKLETSQDGLYWVQIPDLIQNYYSISYVEVRAHYEAFAKEIALKEGTNTYKTTFTLSGAKGESIYINIDTPSARMFKENCKITFSPKNFYVTTPSGKTLYGRITRWSDGKGGIANIDGALKIDNPEDGTYTVTASIEKNSAIAYTFPINAYFPSGTLKFVEDNADNVNINRKSCPNNCNGNGRCNSFNGKCICLMGVIYY